VAQVVEHKTPALQRKKERKKGNFKTTLVLTPRESENITCTVGENICKSYI
jgi:hypothetical protein